jgi:hypothetical protein
MRLVGANFYSTDGQRLFADTESECGPFGTRDVRVFVHSCPRSLHEWRLLAQSRRTSICIGPQFHLHDPADELPRDADVALYQAKADNSPGFAVNRILCAMINEAVFALQEGLATAEDIDAGMKLGCNHPIGPLALADLIGLDTLLSAYGFRSLQACEILIFRRM